MDSKATIGLASIGAFVGMCLWRDWPDGAWSQAEQLLLNGFVAVFVGLFVAPWYETHIHGRSLFDIAWGAAKMALGFIVAVAGVVGLALVFVWLTYDLGLSAWLTVPLVSIGYGLLLAQGMRLIDHFRGVKRTES